MLVDVVRMKRRIKKKKRRRGRRRRRRRRERRRKRRRRRRRKRIRGSRKLMTMMMTTDNGNYQVTLIMPAMLEMGKRLSGNMVYLNRLAKYFKVCLEKLI